MRMHELTDGEKLENEEHAKLQAYIEQLEADAARWRFVKQHCIDRYHISILHPRSHWEFPKKSIGIGDTIEEAIDRAIEEAR